MSTHLPKQSSQVSQEIYDSVLGIIERMHQHYSDTPEYRPMIIKLKSIARELNDIRIREITEVVNP